MIDWGGLLQWSATNAGAFLATLLGVLGAFWLERRRDQRAARERNRSEEDELKIIGSLLADAAQWDVEVLLECTKVGFSDAAVALQAAMFRMAAWTANSARFAELCHDPQERTDFTLFFEELSRIRAFTEFPPPYSIGGSPEHTRWYAASVLLALDLGKKCVLRRGTPAQVTMASASADAGAAIIRQRAQEAGVGTIG
jgi:hypothetical protein